MTRPQVLALVLVGAVPLLVAASPDRELVRQLDNEVIALRQRIQLLEQHCGSEAAAPPIYPQLVQLYAGTPVVVDHVGARVTVTLHADDVFAKDSLTTREEAQPWLDLLAMSLGVNPSTNVMIVGHSDGSPTPGPFKALYPTSSGWTLAQVNAVGDQLIKRYAVPAARITLASRGSSDPVGTNDTPEGRALNRRVVLYISEGKFP